jgi:hypothetical protein
LVRPAGDGATQGAAVVTVGELDVGALGAVEALGPLVDGTTDGNVSIGNTVVVGVSSSSLSKAPPIHAISTTAAMAAMTMITTRTALRRTALDRAALASSSWRLARLAF